MPAAEAREISTARKGAAALSLVASGGTLALDALRHFGPDWVVLAFAGVLAAAGLAITRTSILAQVLSRGAAWITLVPTAIATGAELSYGKTPGATEAILAVGSAAALLLARPMLHTKEAHAEFHPHRFRRSFLAGSTATAATAFLTGGIALEMLGDNYTSTVGFAALTAALLGAAIGVVRMRGWGIVLGAATSVVLLVAAMIAHNQGGQFLALMAMPMLILHLLPIVLARYGKAPASSAETVRYRVADSAPRARIDIGEDLIDADAEELAPLRATSSLRT